MTAGSALVLVAVRLKSLRCPRKALADLAGRPLIVRLHERLSRSRVPDGIVWCTSANYEDDPLKELARVNGVEIFRGDELDVLARFIAAAETYGAAHIVRATGDNPLTDPAMLDVVLREHIAQGVEYTYVSENDMPRGTRVEAISVPALRRCHNLAQDPAQSEYMTVMLRRPDHFRVMRLTPADPSIRRGDIRLTIDTPEDLRVVRAVYEAFGGNPPELPKIIRWLDANPDVKALNSAVRPVDPADHVNVRLKGD